MGTVSNSLNYPERVSPALVKRVNDAINMLGYVPNEAARQLRMGQSQTIGLIVPNFHDPFHAEIARGVDDKAGENQLSVLIGTSGKEASREAHFLSLFEKYRVAGIVMVPNELPLLLSPFSNPRIPLVLAGSDGRNADISSVSTNNFAAGEKAAEFLLSRGAQRIVIVSAAAGSQARFDDRERGALAVLAQRHAGSVEVVRAPALTVRAGREIGDLLRARGAADRPQAVFATHDLWALGVAQSFDSDSGKTSGLTVVGAEDIDSHNLSPVGVNSLRLPAYEIGRESVATLIHALDSEDLVAEHKRLVPTVVTEDSSHSPAPMLTGSADRHPSPIR